MTFRLSDFDFAFPDRLIAQAPEERRDACRLMVVDRATETIRHHRFRDLPALLARGDALVVNTSRVIPARLFGTRSNGARAEVLLVHPMGDGTWLAMVHPGGKLKTGRTVTFGGDGQLTIVDVLDGGVRRVALEGPLSWEALMARHGTVPLPPYIDRPARDADREWYQTVYATERGSVAAPTAGLHFTGELLDAVRCAGVTVVDVILHVGPGTFKPMQVEDPARHRMHAEWYSVSKDTADVVNRVLAGGGRVWAVGTTVGRVLETAGSAGRLRAESGWTQLFIYPPFSFEIVGGLVTNFHLPRSTLLMLVSAFGGHSLVMRAYREAVEHEYRLFSYGDAMMVR